MVRGSTLKHDTLCKSGYSDKRVDRFDSVFLYTFLSAMYIQRRIEYFYQTYLITFILQGRVASLVPIKKLSLPPSQDVPHILISALDSVLSFSNPSIFIIKSKTFHGLTKKKTNKKR